MNVNDIDGLIEKLNLLEPQLAGLAPSRRTAALAEIAGRLRMISAGLTVDQKRETNALLNPIWDRLRLLVRSGHCGWVLALHGAGRMPWGMYVVTMEAIATGRVLPHEAMRAFWTEYLHAVEPLAEDAQIGTGALRMMLLEAKRYTKDVDVYRRLLALSYVNAQRPNRMDTAIQEERERCARLADEAGQAALAAKMRAA